MDKIERLEKAIKTLVENYNKIKIERNNVLKEIENSKRELDNAKNLIDNLKTEIELLGKSKVNNFNEEKRNELINQIKSIINRIDNLNIDSSITNV
jgi:archaellum component FlaC